MTRKFSKEYVLTEGEYRGNLLSDMLPGDAQVVPAPTSAATNTSIAAHPQGSIVVHFVDGRATPVCTPSLRRSSPAAQSSTTSSHLRTRHLRPRSEPTPGLEKDIQENFPDNFNNIFGSVKKKRLAGFLDPFKPTHSTAPFGKLRSVTAGDLADSVPFRDLDVTPSFPQDPFVIWLL